MTRKTLLPYKVLVLLLFCLSVTSYAANNRGIQVNQRRIALVIGNGAYEIAPLSNPANDARDMARILRDLGFEVIEKINANERKMVDAIDEFYQGLRRADVGLFYFAGHGMQLQGRNYLIPVGARVTSATDVEFEAVEAGRVLGKMKSAGTNLNIVIIDACRDNPFKRSFRTDQKGLAQMDAPKGTIIAYATSPGSVAADGAGRNGIYTKHLLKHLKRRELSVQEVLMETGLGVMGETAEKQIPWISSTPIPRYYLAGGDMIVQKPSLKAGKSLLEISVNVLGAKVFLDGREVGRTPLRAMEVTPGDHQILVEKPGYASYRKHVRVEPGRTMSMYVDLSRVKPTKGRLFVEADPEKAEIRILNISPKFFQGIELDEGRYHIEVSSDGYETQSRWVDLKAGYKKPFRFELTTKKVVKPISALKTITNSIGMKFVLIPAGTFMMGSRISPEEVARKYGGKSEWYKDEHPRHEVRISQSFYLQTTEVTVGQWRRFVRDTGFNKTEAEAYGGIWVRGEKKKGIYWDNPGFSKNDRHPVTLVSWDDVQKFIQWLNRKEGGTWYRLPTEAEWEYACRAGTSNTHFWGDGPGDVCRYANITDQSVERKWPNWKIHKCKDGFTKTAPVESFNSNQFGLYDILGNVWEWCQDWDGTYSSGSITDPKGPGGGRGYYGRPYYHRVIRGGSWTNKPRRVRCANRSVRLPHYGRLDLGFRLVRTM